MLDLDTVNVGSCIQWPIIVRPLGYYLDEGMTDVEAFELMRIIQPLSFWLADRFVRNRWEMGTRTNDLHK